MAYRLLISIAAPLFIAMFALRVLRGTEHWRDFRERMGDCQLAMPGPTLWLHGASNGELTGARVLIEALLRDAPDLQIRVTSNTATARDMVRGWGLARVSVSLAPLDTRWALRRFLKTAKPAAYALIEGDFWPNRHAILARRNVPVGIVTARISEKSASFWARMPSAAQAVFSNATRIWPLDPTAQTRLTDLGAPSHVFGPAANLKSFYAAETRDPLPGFQRDVTWLAASTHDGEDDIVLEAHSAVLKTHPDVQLILAPRHPNRADDVAALIRARGLTCHRHSRGETGRGGVYLADTLGEMPQFYASAALCFVAGSLVPKGGHTPFEPIAHGCAILHGPHTDNFSDIYQELARANASLLATDAATLSQAIIHAMEPDRQSAMTGAATAVMQQVIRDDTAVQDIVNTLKTWLFA